MSGQIPQPGSSHASISDQARASIIIAFTHVKRQLRLPIDDPTVTSDMIRKVIALLNDREFIAQPLREIPTQLSIRNIWKRYISHGVLHKVEKGGRPKHKLRLEAEYLINEHDRSTRRVSRLLDGDISYRTIDRMLKEQGMHYYRAPRGHHMPEGNPDRRLQFAETIKQMACHGHIDIHNTCFSDESMIMSGRHVNSQNNGFWRLRGDFHDRQERLVQRKLQGPKTHIFVLLHWKAGLIGPIFIEELEFFDPSRDKQRDTLNARKYIYMLQTFVIPVLKERLGPDFNNCWWQQDGAPSHTAEITISYLRSEFGNRIISGEKLPCGNLFEWPPYSPDLNPLDYWFWTSLKQKVGSQDPSDIEEVKTLIPLACTEFSIPNIQSAIDDFIVRIDCLKFFKVEHFESFLKTYKRLQMGIRTTCEYCNQIHPCSCENCQRKCLAKYVYALTDDAVDMDVDNPVNNPHEDVDDDFISDLDINDLDLEEIN